MIYAFTIFLTILGAVLSVFARKEIDENTDRAVYVKWLIIFSLLGIALIAGVAIEIFGGVI